MTINHDNLVQLSELATGINTVIRRTGIGSDVLDRFAAAYPRSPRTIVELFGSDRPTFNQMHKAFARYLSLMEDTIAEAEFDEMDSMREVFDPLAQSVVPLLNMYAHSVQTLYAHSAGNPPGPYLHTQN